MQRIIIILTGPTAVGKTKVGIQLAKLLNTEIISADSMQIYKYMDIGTAKPTPQERKNIPYHLIDIIEPSQPFNVAEFQQHAQQIMENLFQANKIPIIIGGTRLYIKSITNGLFAGPTAHPEIRKRLTKEVQLKGSQYLYQKLKQIDPQKAKKLHPNDLKRIIRALEVYELTGKPISKLQTHKTIKPNYQAIKIALMRQRRDLYNRIDQRIHQMLDQGLIEEVRTLMQKGYNQNLNSMQGLGYKEIVGYLKGQYDLPEAIRLLQRNTRHFARRQIIWLRNEKDIQYLNIEPQETTNRVVKRVASIIQNQAINEDITSTNISSLGFRVFW